MCYGLTKITISFILKSKGNQLSKEANGMEYYA
jgi:hypothetical protein